MRGEKGAEAILRACGWVTEGKDQCMLPALGRRLAVGLLCSLLRSRPYPAPCEETPAVLPTATSKSREQGMPAPEGLDLHPRHLLHFSAPVPGCSLIPPQEMVQLSSIHGLECPKKSVSRSDLAWMQSSGCGSLPSPSICQ